jgi:ankyrin repeat protein
MMSIRIKEIRFLIIVMMLLSTAEVFSQNTVIETKVDTTDYIPFFYRGALDYNLMIAASRGYTEEVKRLIMTGADVFAETEQGATALILAVSNDQTEVAKLLIDLGADPNKVTSDGETPFFIAVKRQNAEITEALIRAGIDIDNTNKYNATALHYAAVYDYLSLTDMLLYYGASTEIKTTEGSTPLIASVFVGNAAIADLLIQNGANIEATDNEGYTPFQIAALHGDTLIMKLLYINKANIYAVNNAKHNALTISIIANQLDATRYLLALGDKWTSEKYNALNPYLVAAKYGRKEIIKILQEHNIPGTFTYNIDQVAVSVSSRFSLHDIYMGTSFSFREPYLNGGIIVGLDSKLWYTRVLDKQTENLFYQYWNKGSVIYTGLFKNFPLTDNAFKANFELSASLSAGYSFANDLRGTLYTPKNRFLAIPALSLKITKRDYSFSLGVEYSKSDFFRTGPVWIRFGGSYNFYFDNVRARQKTLKWY